ncbi:hypothetical protein V1478_013664 [Vespula squamosa]|uniref:Uncharacterized protein n=1 Tax=Vespula squamosa TaxID=30214 RepID=A0ABD2A5T7_VESSQ
MSDDLNKIATFLVASNFAIDTRYIDPMHFEGCERLLTFLEEFDQRNNSKLKVPDSFVFGMQEMQEMKPKIHNDNDDDNDDEEDDDGEDGKEDDDGGGYLRHKLPMRFETIGEEPVCSVLSPNIDNAFAKKMRILDLPEVTEKVSLICFLRQRKFTGFLVSWIERTLSDKARMNHSTNSSSRKYYRENKDPSVI